MTEQAHAAWRPTAKPDNLRVRAQMLASIRQFFATRNILEVETPLLSAAASTDINLAPVPAGGGYLHTSPEFAMKRLLAAGSGDIYQICKVFRQGESGSCHNPEFTLLEWYRAGWDYRRLMTEVAALLSGILDFAHEPQYISYREAFQQVLSLDPFSASDDELADAAAKEAFPHPESLDRDGLLDLLAGLCVYHELGRDRLNFVYDFPPSQAALARLRYDKPPVAERFEVMVNGLELGNGFSELTNAAEQRARFESDLTQRRQKQLPTLPMDEHFLAALEAGLPESAGVAIGLDRVAMLACRTAEIADVMTFTQENA